MAEKQMVLVDRNGNGRVGPPEGFAPLVGEDLFRLKESALALEVTKANIETAKARIREHQNGFEAAKAMEDQETAKLQALMGEKVGIEAELGIKKPDDLKIFGGLYFRRINGEAKPAAEGKPAVAPGERPTPE
jgi:hypothetical protein